MFIYCLIMITLLYYLILWRVTAKKAALERASREAFGPVTGIQDLLTATNRREEHTSLVQPPSSSREEIFGPISSIQELTNQVMSKQNIINSVSLASNIKASPFKKDVGTTHTAETIETTQEAQLRHSIFAGSSLAKNSINSGTNSDSVLLKNTLDAISEKVLEAELDAIVDELEDTIPSESTTTTNNTLPLEALSKSELDHQLNILFEKDYQDYV